MTDQTPAAQTTEPRTEASKAALEWIAAVEPVDDPAGNTIYDEMRLNFLPRIEAEAAALPAAPAAPAVEAER